MLPPKEEKEDDNDDLLSIVKIVKTDEDGDCIEVTDDWLNKMIADAEEFQKKWYYPFWRTWYTIRDFVRYAVTPDGAYRVTVTLKTEEEAQRLLKYLVRLA